MLRHLFWSLLALLLAAWCIYPFVNLKVNPAFNSDTALVLTAITERVPLAETIFSWGTARSGSTFLIPGSIYFHLFGGRPLLDFLSVVNALVVVLGCCVFLEAPEKTGLRPRLLLLPAGLLLVFPNFNIVPSSASFAFTITDLGHRPELMALLVFLSWLFLSLERYRPLKERGWWIRFLLALFLAATATWVSDLALIAGLLFASVAALRAFLLKVRIPWETFAVWLFSILTLLLLRRLSLYGRQETGQLFKLPDGETLQNLLGRAFENLFSNLTTVTWLVALMLAISLAGWGIISWRRGGDAHRQRGLWQAGNLVALGVLALVVPFANDWVFANGAHPRYFSIGALLLCVGVTQGIVLFVQRSWGTPNGSQLIGGAVVVLLLPFAFTGAGAFRVRHQLASGGTSDFYRAGGILFKAGIRGIIGPYWDSYAYVLARPGQLKATPIDSDWDRSVSNTMHVLAAPRIAWITREPLALGPSMRARGLELTQIDAAPPRRLPTGAYFKEYTSGALTVRFGSNETALYLKEGWSGPEREGSRTWIWALGERAVMELPLSGSARYRMTINAHTIPKEGRRQEVTVTVDGVTAGIFRFARDGRPLEASLSLPPSAEGVRKRRVELGFAYSVIPKASQPGSRDERELAVAFERAEFTPER